MIKDVLVPEISENVESGEVLNILVKQGDRVSAQQALVELETEKAAFDVPSPVDGQIAEILIKEGDRVTVGQVIFKIETEPTSEAKAETKPEPSKKELTEKPQPAPEPRSEKPQTRIKQAERPQPAEEQTKERPSVQSEAVGAAPSVRQLARELGISIEQVRGTGPAGRISVDDVKSYARELLSQRGAGGAQQVHPQAPPLPDFSKWGPVERQSASATRKKVAETMSNAWSQVAHVTQHDTADITLLREFIAEYSEPVKQAGGKLTVTSILLKVIANVLQSFPKLNASYDPEAEEVIFKKYYHVAVAVDTDRGLLVPVIRDADQKTMLQLSVELSQIAEKARQHKVTPDEMLGGTFTVTNLGGIGGSFFTPIVYWPQVAILGISRTLKQPIYTEDGLVPRWMLPLSLSYDHRLVDGAEGIRFLRAVIEQLEKPFQLALHEQ